MNETLDKLEEQVYRSYWDDGLLDVFAAVGILLIGSCWMLDQPGLGAIVPALLVPLWPLTRQQLIEPRLGLVEFSVPREQRNRRHLAWTIVLGIGAFMVLVGAWLYRDEVPVTPTEAWIPALPAALLAILAGLTAALTAAIRFLGYALVLVFTGLAGAWLGWEPGLILAATGGLLLAMAATILTRFLRSHPVVTEPDA